VKKICLLMILLVAFVVAGCSQHDASTGNSNQTQAQATTSPGPDNSEITTSVDASGTRTETRTFRNNPHISKVTVTTRDGKRTCQSHFTQR
jgi:PBP1b-binding outer membrane lipoprotein LpoB